MIISRLEGGLGNQLFQYAAGRALAYRRSDELKLDPSPITADTKLKHARYQLGNFNILETFATEEEISGCAVVKENNAHSYTPNVCFCPENSFLHGYWQSELYFSDIADLLRRELTLKRPPEKISSAWREKILAAECSVSVHVRMGDYLKPFFRNHSGIVPVEYYNSCVEILRQEFPKLTIFVFSDDLDWARKNLSFDAPTEFVEGCEHDYEEMHLMSLCDHNIITNSTFSWWSAWLNPNPQKKVFAPEPWHRDGWGGDTVIPVGWTKIPVDYENSRPFAPVLSIVVAVEDSKPLDLTCASIFENNLNDYEVIFVVADREQSANLCRKFADRANVSCLKVSPTANKSFAWNLGLSCARGDYVLFLTGRDFILQHTVLLLCGTLDLDLKESNFQRHTNYGRYLAEEAPDIICATGRLECTLKNVFDGKFEVNSDLVVDSRFQAQKENFRLQLPAVEKLSALAENQLNSLVGTKFFKRKFLLDNGIRFGVKNNSEATELIFSAETLLKTENILLTAQYFHGRLN